MTAKQKRDVAQSVPAAKRRQGKRAPAQAGVAARSGLESAGSPSPLQADVQPPLCLPADLRVSQAAATYAALVAVDPKLPLVIHAEAVSRADAAGLQAVLAALMQRRATGGSWRWHNPSSALATAAALLDLKGTLDLP